MSAVRMCDSCGEIFSEREEGWASMQAQRMTRKDGRPVSMVENLDSCPACTNGERVQRPRLAIDSATGVDRIAKTQTQADRDRILGTLSDDENPF